MNARERARWRRLTNRACRAFRYNVPQRERVAFRLRMQAEVAKGDPAARAWAATWGGP